MSTSITHGGGNPDLPLPISTSNDSQDNNMLTTSDATNLVDTPEISQPEASESSFPSDRLYGPYPSRSAAALAAAQIPQCQSPGSPFSSNSSTTTEGRPSKPPNILELPHPASIGTICLSGTLVEKLQAISEAGFNKVEIYENDLVNFLGQLSEINDLCWELGLGIGSMRTDEGLEGIGDPIDGGEEAVVQMRRARERLESKFTKMDKLGTDLLVVPPGSTANPLWTREQTIRDLQKAAELAERRQKRIALRHISGVPNIDRWEVAWDLVRAVNRSNFGLCLDTFYIFCRPDLAPPPVHAPVTAITAHNAAVESTLAALAALPKDKIFSIYLSDGPFLTGLNPYENARHRIFPGHGEMKLKEFLKAVVVNSGYAGSLTLEALNDDYRSSPPKKITFDGRRCIMSLLSEVYDPYYPGNERQNTDSDQDIELYDHDQVPPPQLSKAGFILPPTGTIYGIKFVEFVVNEARVEALGRWLERIGMRRMGEHSTKKILMFQNGEILIFLNFDPTLYASRSVYLRRGIGVASVGVRVSDAQCIVDRARCLNYSVVPVSLELAPGDVLVTVEAPDETLIVLIDNDHHLMKGFENKSAPDNTQNDREFAGSHLKFIDHFAQALDRHMLESFIIFYKSIFGMQSQTLFEVSDPYGSAKSRAMVSGPSTLASDDDPTTLRGGLRFPINTIENKESHMGKLVNMAGGSIIHHLALATDDIFEFSEAIRKKHPTKHAFLKVPPHYYDELRCKYVDLSEEFITRMKVNDILYDRIDGGEFLMLNTELFEERFFVEICERRQGYGHFGAVNSEIREVTQFQYKLTKEKIKAVHEVDWAREKKRRKVQSNLSQQEGRRIPVVVVVHSEGLIPDYDQTADVLGCEYVVIDTWEELQDIEARANNAIVVAIEKQRFIDHFLPRWESPGSPTSDTSIRTDVGGVKRVLINTVRAERANPEDQQMGDICDYEFYYPDRQGTRQQYARFLSFVLQLNRPHPHEEITAKPRSAVLTIPFADVREFTTSMDILTIGVDVVELRVDLLQENPTNGVWRMPSIKYVGEQLMWLRQSTALPIVFTIRSIPEGGKFPLDDIEVAHKLLKKGLQWGCEYLDVEILRIPKDIRSQLYYRRGMTRIISTYCATTRFPWMSPNTMQIYQSGRRYGDVVRILGFADDMSDNHELENFRSAVNRSYDPPVPLIAINMGEAGQLSRLLNALMTPVTHSMIAGYSPHGQISVSDLHSALHIIGQLPKQEFYCLSMEPLAPSPIAASAAQSPINCYNYGDPFSPAGLSSNMSHTAVTAPLNSVALFIGKCLKELNLPYRLTCLPLTPQDAEDTVTMLLRSSYFGGAGFGIPFPPPTNLPILTPAARAIGTIDVIFQQAPGTPNSGGLVGDNLSFRSIQRLLLHEFSAEAYRGKAGLVLSTTEREAAAAVYALRSVGVSKIYTIGFGKGAKQRGFRILGAPDGDVELEYLESHTDLIKVVQPFVVVSVLRCESAKLVLPILEQIAQTCTAQGLNRRLAGRVFVEVISNFPVTNGMNPRGPFKSDIASEARRNQWMFAYGAIDIQAMVVTEKLRLMSGQHVGYGFMRMAAATGLY